MELDEALAAERRATVERIREAVTEWYRKTEWQEIATSDVLPVVGAILDEEMESG